MKGGSGGGAADNNNAGGDTSAAAPTQTQGSGVSRFWLVSLSHCMLIARWRRLTGGCRDEVERQSVAQLVRADNLKGCPLHSLFSQGTFLLFLYSPYPYEKQRKPGHRAMYTCFLALANGRMSTATTTARQSVFERTEQHLLAAALARSRSESSNSQLAAVPASSAASSGRSKQQRVGASAAESGAMPTPSLECGQQQQQRGKNSSVAEKKSQSAHRDVLTPRRPGQAATSTYTSASAVSETHAPTTTSATATTTTTQRDLTSSSDSSLRRAQETQPHGHLARGNEHSALERAVSSAGVHQGRAPATTTATRQGAMKSSSGATPALSHFASTSRLEVDELELEMVGDSEEEEPLEFVQPKTAAAGGSGLSHA